MGLIQLPGRFGQHLEANPNFLVGMATTVEAASATGEFACITLQGSATKRVMITAVSGHLSSTSWKLGHSNVFPLDGADDDLIAATDADFPSDGQAARTAVARSGKSLTARGVGGFRLTGHGAGQLLELPVALFLQGASDWFFICGDTANEALECSMMWVELPIIA